MATFSSAYLKDGQSTVELTSTSAATAYIEYLSIANLRNSTPQYEIYYTDATGNTYDDSDSKVIIHRGHLKAFETLVFHQDDFPKGDATTSFFGNDATNKRLYVALYIGNGEFPDEAHVIYKRVDVSDLPITVSYTEDQLQDLVGAMFSSNTETRISVTYDDGDGTIDLVVDDMTANTQLPLIDSDTMSGASSTNVSSAESVKAYVDTSISNVLNSPPAALDTLNELAAALGDDANFSSTVTNSIALKAPIASPSFTGTIAIPNIANIESAITANTAKPDVTVSGSAVHTDNITDLHGAGVSGSANQLLTDDGDGTVTSESDLTFASNILELGGDNSDSLTIQRKTHGDSSGGQLVIRGGDGTGTNKGGGILRFHGGRGTGTGASGEIRFSVSSSGSSGTTQHSDPFTRILTLTDATASVIGNLAVTGTVDGRDVSVDGTKLDGIASGATAYVDADAVSAVAAADNYLKNDTSDEIAGTLTMQESIFLQRADGTNTTKTKLKNNTTTSNRTLTVPDATGTIALTNKLIVQLTTSYYSSSTAYYYEPLHGYIAENTTVSSYVSNFVAAYDGKIIKIAGYNSGTTSKTREFKMFLNRQATTQTGTTATTDAYATTSMPILSPTDWAFSAGDSIAVRTTNSVAVFSVNTTFIIEYDTTT